MKLLQSIKNWLSLKAYIIKHKLVCDYALWHFNKAVGNRTVYKTQWFHSENNTVTIIGEFEDGSGIWLNCVGFQIQDVTNIPKRS